MKKRLLSLVLALCMVLSLLPGLSFASEQIEQIAVVLHSAQDADTDTATVKLGFTDGTSGTYTVSRYTDEYGTTHDANFSSAFANNALVGNLYSCILCQDGTVELTIVNLFLPDIAGDTQILNTGLLLTQHPYPYYANEDSLIFLLYTDGATSRDIQFKVCKLVELDDMPAAAIPVYTSDTSYKTLLGGTALTTEDGYDLAVGVMTFGTDPSTLPEVSIPEPTPSTLTWAVSGDTLTISGEGAMDPVPTWSATPKEIKHIIIEDGITSIGYEAFYDYTAVTSIKIPASLTTIENSTFSPYGSLTDVYYDGTFADWKNISIGTGNSEFSYARYHFTSPAASGTIDDNITWNLDENGHLTVSGTGSTNLYHYDNAPWYPLRGYIKTVSVASGITDLGEQAFSECDSLTSISLPDTLASIERRVFVACTSLKSVVLPPAIPEIGAHAFWGCSSLKSIVIPATVTSIESKAFYNCTALTDVYYTGSEADWAAITIATENDPLANATIHYNSDLTAPLKLSTVDGAQIRTSGVQGLRFISKLDKTSVSFSRVVEYGTVLIPSADLSDLSQLKIGATLNGHAVAKVPARYIYSETDTEITFTAVLINIKEANYAREYTARAYAILEDGSVVYSDTGASRSIYGVAQRGLQNPNESDANKALFQQIIDTVEQA